MSKFKIKEVKIEPKDTVVLNRDNNKRIFAGARFCLFYGQQERQVGQVFKVENLVDSQEIGLSRWMINNLGAQAGDLVSLKPISRVSTRSYSLIKQKISIPGKIFDKAEIDQIVTDIATNNLTPLESSVFITSQLFQEWSIGEIDALTQAIASTGQILNWQDDTVFDKHSLGGVPGNKVTLLIVPIIAAAGLLIPKTSSRAITSPSGTADTVEALGCDIQFSVDELQEISRSVGGLIAWTGALNIVPVDEKIIRDVQYPLGLDPEPMMIASVLSKKVAMGVNFLVLDIPTGIYTKVKDLETGRRIAHRFSELGQRLGIRIECGITYGNTPIGHAIGPSLEAREALEALMYPQKASDSLIGKSTSLAGILLEMAGKALPGEGQYLASEILTSGSAYKKFQEILEAQNADPKIKPEDLETGSCIYEYCAPENGWIVEINNKVMVNAAKAAGAPMDKGAGIHFLKKKDSVKRGEVIFTIHASDEKKLAAAEAELAKEMPLTIEGMLLARE